MKFVKSISLFLIIPAVIFVLGFFLGGRFSAFFYPGNRAERIYAGEETKSESSGKSAVPESRTDPGLQKESVPDVEEKPGVIQKEEEIRIMRYGERAVWEDVEIAVVLKGNLVSENNIFVYCERKNASSLSFGVSGVRYDEFYVSKGDEVTKGQLLAKLECDDYKEQKEALQYELLRIDIELKQLESDFLNYGMSLKEYERKKADYENQKLVLKQRMEELSVYISERYIYADMDGVVKEMAEVDSQDLSEEGLVIFELTGGQQEFRGNTADTRKLAIGQIYSLTLDGEVYEVVLDRMDDGEIGDVQVVFTFADGQEHSVTSERGVVRYVVEEAKDVLYIPKSAVSKGGEHYYVYFLNEAGFREMKEISISDSYGDYYVVTAGLTEGEEILCD